MAPSLLLERFGSMMPLDDKTEIELLSCEVPKIRLLQSLSIQGSKGPQYSMQVLHFAMFPEPEYDLPIFCANFSLLDLDPLYDVVKHKEYKDKCYESLMSQLLPWVGNLTGESLRFFSPIVIWTRFKSSQHMHDAWLVLMDLGIRETDASQIIANREAQHRYLTLRAEKVNHLVTHLLPYLHLQPTCEVYLLHAHAETIEDPGYEVLKRLLGETQAKIEMSFTAILRSFLFDRVDSLGSKTFLDYFPEYPCQEGRVN
ncbi:hypothetical protein ACJRO7_026487 [Eucalyptus globulus]|uniref:Uncharacterized protein n=1 Tax=Eucalyptus globulus TaxID=34317 RepID=A0ABD3JQV8_EUCGL